MKIVYFYQYFGTSQGGWSTRVYEMCKRWVAEGHEVTVVTTPYDKSDIPRRKGLAYSLNYDGIRVIVINFPQSNKNPIFRRIIDFLKYLVLALYYGLRLPCDIAICSSGPISVGLVGIICSKLRRKKFVFEVRDLWPAGAIQLGIISSPWLVNLSKWFEKKCYQHAHLVVAASQGMHDDILLRYPDTPIVVVPNASDLDIFANATPKVLPAHLQGKKILLYTGSLGQMDQCMQIMHAARLINTSRYPDLHLVIIGEGVDRPEMEAYRQAHQLNHVSFTGLIPKTEVAQWYQHALASIITFRNLPVLHTSSPNKLFDSFAAGVPVIQTTQGWIKQLLQEHQAGITVMPDDAQGLCKAMEYYASHQAERKQHAANAYSLALHQFNRDAIAQTMLDAMVKLVPTFKPNATPLIVVTDWYTPSSHATSLRMAPWIEALQKTGNYRISVYTDKVSRRQPMVRANLFKSPDNRNRPVGRVIQEFFLGSELFVKLLLRKKTWVIISSPPFIASSMAACACFISRKPYVFDVRDVYPLVYANSGFITRRGYLFKILNKVAQQCYLHSQFITTVTPKLVRYLQTFSGRRQVHLIKNGYNHRIFKPSAEKFDRFTLVFHGNIGQFQHPQLLVDVVNELNHRGLLFDCLVIGSGSRQQVIEKQQIPNLKYLGRLENEKLYRIISKAHVGISFRTDDEISTRSIPVKLSEYVGVGIPSVLTPKSEGGDLLDQLHLGRSFGNQELQQICDFITRLHDNEGYYQHYVQHIMQVRPMFSREAGAQLLADLMYHYQHHPGEEFVNQHTQVFSLLPEVTA